MSTAVHELRCANCGAMLAGAFCSSCGQKRVHPRPTLHDFVHEATHEFLHVDGKVFRTFKLLLLKPGALTVEFNEGRRASMISPLRVYLLCSVLFFGMVALRPADGMGVTYRPTGGSSAFEKKIESGVAKAQRDPTQLARALQSAWPKAMFVLMPVFALLLLLLFRSREPLYVPHLYASIHLHAFAFLAFSASLLLRMPGWSWLRPIALLLVLVPIPYFFLAIRRIYSLGTTSTILRGLAIAALYFPLLLVAILLVVLYAVTHL